MNVVSELTIGSRMRFANAPLIESVAEFRWLPTSSMGEPIENPQALGIPGPDVEAFYQKIRALLSNIGYSSAERLVPEGFPYPMYQPVFRFRRPHESEGNEIFQVGVGLFSVHTLPPYENWERFKPIIATGLAELLSARNAVAKYQTAFTGVSLRYINAFTPIHLDGKSPFEFLRDVIGIRIELPHSLKKQILDERGLDAGVNIVADLGQDLQFVLGTGRNAKFPGSLILDLAVQTGKTLPWAETEAMSVLSLAHTAISDAFLGMTAQIYPLMEMES